MKGYKNIRQITERVMCQEELAQKILKFEDNKYLKVNKQNFWIYEIPFDQCISLQDLIESIQDNYIKIFKGQALLIMEKIVEHLYELHKLNIIHDNLNSNNIFIKLTQNSKRFNIYQENIQIEQIYFTNYKWLDNEIQEYSFTDDLKKIKEYFTQFIQVIDSKEQEIINLIKNFDIKNDRKHTQKMLTTLKEYIEQNVNQTTQQLKKNELTNYNSYLKLRYNFEGLIQQQIVRIFNLEQKYTYTIEDNELDVSIIQIIQSKTDQIQKFLLQNFHQKLLRKFQKYAGNLLENNYKISEKDFNTYFEDRETDQQLGFKMEQLKQNFLNIIQLPEQTQTKINEKFKFQFDKYDKMKLMEIYEDFLYSNSIKYDLNIETEVLKMLEDIYKQMKEYLEEYYELELYLKIIELISSLV